MKLTRYIAIAAALLILGGEAVAQIEQGSVRRRTERDKKEQTSGTGITERMQKFYETKQPHDADLEYMREIYRMIDLTKDANTPLYFPEDVVDGQQNLFRIIMQQVADGKLPAYEYLDGREVFTDKYKVNVPEMLDRFGIYYTQGKGGKVEIEEADVPTGQVLTYYVIEKWEFDRRTNRMKTRVEAICPVLTRTGDFGGEARFPMFWVKYDQLRPWLASQYIFLSDDNNLPQYSLDDYFNLGMYDGEIYKTKNLRNLSMMQMYPDPDDLKRAQDSIDNRLRNYGKDLWVPTREEYLAAKEKEAELAAAAAAGDTISDRTTVIAEPEPSTARAKRSTTAKKRTSAAAKRKKSSSVSSQNSNSGNSNAVHSVRRRKK